MSEDKKTKVQKGWMKD
jgi:superfamily II DNA helicase RecQ